MTGSSKVRVSISNENLARPRARSRLLVQNNFEYYSRLPSGKMSIKMHAKYEAIERATFSMFRPVPFGVLSLGTHMRVFCTPNFKGEKSGPEPNFETCLVRKSCLCDWGPNVSGGRAAPRGSTLVRSEQRATEHRCETKWKLCAKIHLFTQCFFGLLCGELAHLAHDREENLEVLVHTSACMYCAGYAQSCEDAQTLLRTHACQRGFVSGPLHTACVTHCVRLAVLMLRDACSYF